MSDLNEEGRRYAIRLAVEAEREIEGAFYSLLSRAGEAAADAWRSGLFEQISHLSTSPNYPVAAESELLPFPIHAFPYRRPGASVAYRIFYEVVEETPDGPQVWILHLRPGAAGPMQGYEAREIEIRSQEMGGGV